MPQKSNIVIGKRVVIGQAIMALLNAGVLLWNYVHPDATIDGSIASYLSQPIIFFIQVWWANKYGVTTGEEDAS